MEMQPLLLEAELVRCASYICYKLLILKESFSFRCLIELIHLAARCWIFISDSEKCSIKRSIFFRFNLLALVNTILFTNGNSIKYQFDAQHWYNSCKRCKWIVWCSFCRKKTQSHNRWIFERGNIKWRYLLLNGL